MFCKSVEDDRPEDWIRARKTYVLYASAVQPVAHTLQKLRDIQRLGDVSVHTGFPAGSDVIRRDIGRKGQDRDGPGIGPGQLADGPGSL